MSTEQNKKPTIYLHVGYPKTGTTTFHEYLTPKVVGIKCFTPSANQQFIESSNNPNDLNLNYQLRVFFETFWIDDGEVEKTLSMLENSGSDRILISTTGPLSALFFKGHYTKRGSYITPEKIAAKIKEVFDSRFNVKIIVVIRRQDTWLESAYAEWFEYFSRQKKYSNLEKFVSHALSPDHQFSKSIDYFEVISAFEKEFGVENLLIQVYEEMVEDAPMFFLKMLKFVNATLASGTNLNDIPKKNQRDYNGKVKKANKLNLYEFLYFLKLRLIPNVSFHLIRKVPKLIQFLSLISLPNREINQNIKMLDNQKDRVRNMFATPNAKLSEKYGLRLHRFGYCNQ